MIPTPRPGDVPDSPERTGPPNRGLEPTPLLFQGLEDIEELKKAVKTLNEKVQDLESRIQNLENQMR